MKWVETIILSEQASELDSGSRLDRHFAPDITWDAHKEHTALDRCPEREGAVPCHESPYGPRSSYTDFAGSKCYLRAWKS